MNKKQDLQKLERYSEHPDPAIRLLALESLRNMGMENRVLHSEITPVLQKMMHDEDFDIRIRAVNTLLDLANKRRTPTDILTEDTQVTAVSDLELYRSASRKLGKKLKPGRRRQRKAAKKGLSL